VEGSAADRRWLGRFTSQAPAADAIEDAPNNARHCALPPGGDNTATDDAAGNSASWG
jgi:hypothetical protein